MSQEQKSPTQQFIENSEEEDVRGCSILSQDKRVASLLHDAIALSLFEKQLKKWNVTDEYREQQLEQLSQIFAMASLPLPPQWREEPVNKKKRNKSKSSEPSIKKKRSRKST